MSAVGDPQQKLAFAALVEAHRGNFISIIHPKANILENVKIGSGCVIAPYSIVSCDTELGCHVIVNDAATIGHDCRIGDGCTISPGAHLAGRVQLERGVFIGIGANIIPDIKIGENSIVGAGATVVKDVPPNVVVAGVPARIIKHIHSSTTLRQNMV